METRLLVTIDTEEDWQGPGEAKEPTFENIYQIPELQRGLFDALRIKPVYLVTYSVAMDAKSASILKEIQSNNRCEIGAHLHSWFVPPVDPRDILHKVFQYELPPAIEKQKIETLTRLLEEKFKTPPVTFRAGRWGADGETIRILSELGYKVDLSVLPLVNASKEGGMDFMDAPFEPYYPDFEDILQSSQGNNNSVLEIPPTAGFSGKNFESLRTLYKRALGFPRQLRAVGVLDRLGIVRKLALCPERNNFEEMKTLVDRCLERKHKVLHLTFHSSMIVAGTSPYSRTKKERDVRFVNLQKILEYIVKEKDIRCVAMETFYKEFCEEAGRG